MNRTIDADLLARASADAYYGESEEGQNGKTERELVIEAVKGLLAYETTRTFRRAAACIMHVLNGNENSVFEFPSASLLDGRQVPKKLREAWKRKEKVDVYAELNGALDGMISWCDDPVLEETTNVCYEKISELIESLFDEQKLNKKQGEQNAEQSI